jgi:Uma2 family endonuclease
MSTAIDTGYTAEDLLTMPDGDLYELVDGQLVERDMGTESGFIAAQLVGLLFAYLKDHQEGWIFSSDASFQCFPGHPNRVRKPDVSFIRMGRLPNERPPSGHCLITPDLVAEVVSPNDLYREVIRKVFEYLEAGVLLIWVIDPNSRSVLAYRADGSVSLLHEHDELSGESVLKNFTCKISELFPPKPVANNSSADAEPNG